MHAWCSRPASLPLYLPRNQKQIHVCAGAGASVIVEPVHEGLPLRCGGCAGKTDGVQGGDGLQRAAHAGRERDASAGPVGAAGDAQEQTASLAGASSAYAHRQLAPGPVPGGASLASACSVVKCLPQEACLLQFTGGFELWAWVDSALAFDIPKWPCQLGLRVMVPTAKTI